MSLEGQERQRDIKAKEKKAAELAKAEIDRAEARESIKLKESQKTQEKQKPPSVPGIKPRRGGAAPSGPFAITLPPPKTGRRGAAFKPDKNIVDVANDLFEKANLPSVQDQNAAVKDLGISGARQKFKPTVDEALARLGLAVLEPIIGGAEEATLGAIGNQNVKRAETQSLRILGAIATPTVADMVIGWTLAKAGATAVGRRALKKMNNFLLDIGDPVFPKLTAAELDEVRQWEKLGGGLTNLRRTAQKSPEILNSIEEIAEFYEKNPALFSAGASVIPEDVFIFQSLAREYDFEVDELINFIKTNDDFFADGTVLTAILGTLSKKDAKKLLQETTELPDIVIPDLINRIEDITVTSDTVEEIISSKEADKPVPIIVPPDVVPDVKPDVIPDEIVDVIPTIDEDTLPAEITKQEQIQITEQLTEQVIVDEIPATPPVKLKKRDLEKRKKLSPRLFRGRKQKYRVIFHFNTTTKETKTVEARSFPEAVQKAQRRRRPRKKQPILVDVVKLKR